MSDTPRTDAYRQNQDLYGSNATWELMRSLEQRAITWESIAREALVGFRLTQDPADYPPNHWSNRIPKPNE